MRVIRKKYETNVFGEKSREPFETKTEELDLRGYYDLMYFEKMIETESRASFWFNFFRGEIESITKKMPGYTEEIRIIG